jgi:hypothetical protein
MAALGSLMPDGLEGNQNWKLKTQEKVCRKSVVREVDHRMHCRICLEHLHLWQANMFL